MIGRTLTHCRVTTAIGAGGMGEVYRATDTKLGREVAIKLLPEASASDPERLARFEREARLPPTFDEQKQARTLMIALNWTPDAVKRGSPRE
jgi:serine/threonine protein kinase